MKIKTIEIYGYGKWIDTTFQVDDSFQIFYGGNESGKTTLMSFIHSMLFGFPHRQSADLRYEPKVGSRYGGKLIIEDPHYGEVSIERVKGRSSGEVTVMLENGKNGSDELLNELLNGIDKDWYRAIFSFNLDGIQNVEQMTKEKWNRYFLSTGTLGTEQFLKEADRLNASASKLYKPTGRVPAINRKLKEVDAKQKQLEAAKKKNAHYSELLKEKEAAEEKIAQIQSQSKELETRLSELKELRQRWATFEEMLFLENELRTFSFEMLPEDGLAKLNQYNNELESLRNQEVEEREKIRQYQKIYRPSKLLDLYQQNPQSFEQVEADLESVQLNLMKYQQVAEEEADLHQEIVQEKLAIGLNPLSPLPQPLNHSELEALHERLNQLEKLETERGERQAHLAYLHYEEQSLSKEIDQLEEQLWPSKEYEEVHQSVTERQKKDAAQASVSQKSNHKGGWVSLTGALAVLASLFLNPPILWILGGFGVLLILIGWVLSKRQKNALVEEKAGFSYEDYIKQSEIRKTWRLKLAQADQNEQEKQTKESQLTDLETEKQNVHLQSRDHLFEKGYPEEWSIETILEKEISVKSIQTKEQKLNEKRTRKNEINAYFKQWRQTLRFLEDELEETSANHDLFRQVKTIIQTVKKEEKEQQEYLFQAKEANRELERIVQSIRKAEQKKKRLLQAVEVESEEAFRDKYAQKEEMAQKQTRHQLLKEQIAGSIEGLEHFHTREEIEQEVECSSKKLKQFSQEKEKAANRKIQKQLEIKRLEEGGEYAVLLQEFENIKSELQSLVDEWASFKIAAELIERTLNDAKKDRLPGTIADAQHYFAELTNGEYTKIKLEENSFKVLNKNGLLYDAGELSRGTAEQLYVALRFAFIHNIRDALQMPLLVDDGFVNFDPSRKRQMWSLLKKTSRHNQILYFTFDSETIEELQYASVNVL